MRLSPQKLRREAEATGFRPEVLEKAIQLLSLLERLQSHPFLKGKLALKGGTALNLFLWDLPRLSVDIDLNYVGALERGKMEEQRPKVQQAVQAVCSREGIDVARVPTDHAGGKWRLRYASALTGSGNLELDLNFMFRVPLWPVAQRDSRKLGSYRASGVPLLDIHELAAGKLAALLSRCASRDLFDAHMLLTRGGLDAQKLRLGFVLYGAMNRKDWRTVRPENVEIDARELRNQLLPVVRGDFTAGIGGAKEWAARLVDECRAGLGALLPLAPGEREFLDRVLDHGEIEPSLLTADEAMSEIIGGHPLLQWKALNVRKHKGE
jgi:predicted nucleotidyltransferase component of viral defense system